MFPSRQIYARVVISAERIAEAVATDKALDRRMADLSDRHKAKAWRRIQSRRIYQLMVTELRDVVEDIKRRACGDC